MNTLNFTTLAVLQQPGQADMVFIHTDYPSGNPAFPNERMTLSMTVGQGLGVEYVRKNFGVEPEVIPYR